MTQTKNRMMDEFAKLMSDAAGVAKGARREVETAVRHQFERFSGEMDLVKREEFDAVSEMASLARKNNEALKAEIAKLEARLAKLEGKPSKASAGKTAAKKTPGNKAAASKTAAKPRTKTSD